MYQDNKRTILLEDKGKGRPMNKTEETIICYYFMAHNTEKRNLEVGYCTTAEMIYDFISTPLETKIKIYRK